MKHWKEIDASNENCRAEEGFHTHDSREGLKDALLYPVALILLIVLLAFLTGRSASGQRNPGKI
jgi:hypothetical protein